MSELKQLLKEWAEREPNRCKADVVHKEVLGWYVFQRDSWRKAHSIVGFDEDRILGAVMEAVESRGWWINLSSQDEDDQETGVMIYTVEVYTAWGKEPNWISGEPDSSPAIAVLDAYLQAIKQEVS